MKKTTITKLFIAGALVFSGTIVGCASGAADDLKELQAKLEKENAKSESKKGAWTDEEKAKADAEIAKVRSSIETSLGDNTDAYIECYLEKIQATYDNFDAANSDVDGCTELAEQCISELDFAE